LVAKSGSERLEGAVPMICNPGDVVMCNRQLLHGSFPNCGFEKRVTVNFGFHKRSSVLGTKGGGIHSEAQVFDEETINRRSKSIGYAIEARKSKYKDEKPYEYKPFLQSGKTYLWDEKARQDLIDYNLEDLSI
jgi:ectoine hydroxylase-related dioxygenase (phytanoyl-CoA dioxygenase family)